MSVVKEELCESESDDDASEATAQALYVGHVVKDELVPEPEEIQHIQTNQPKKDCKDEHGTIKQVPMVINHNGRDFTLRPCFINLRRVDDLFENWNINEPRHTCKVCQQSYKLRQNLIKHMRHHVKESTDVKKLIWYDNQREIYICDDCGKVYFRKMNLIQHVQLHIHVKVYHRMKRARVLGLLLTDPSALFVNPKVAPIVAKARLCAQVQQLATPLPESEVQIAEQSTDSGTHDAPEAKTMIDEPNPKQENQPIPINIPETQAKKEIFVCDICGAWFARKSLLIKHMRAPRNHRSRPQLNETPKSHYVCDICKVPFPSTYTLTSHLLHAHAAVRAYSCRICHKEFAFKYSLAIHEKIHKKRRPRLFCCGLCKQRFMTKQALRNHYLCVHNKDKSYLCDICLRKFVRRFDLACHIRTHTGDRPYACGSCPKRFSQKSTLNKHVQTQHTEVKPFHCKICHKQFAANSSLTVHARTHSEHKPFACDMCEKRFHDNSHLTSHKMTHTGLKPHECKICSKRFLAKGNLTRHELTHTGNRNHQCEICQKMFSVKDTLTRHKKIHDGSQKKVMCPICNKWYVSINGHLKIHSGEKPFQCRFCNKAFVSKMHLARHEYVHVGERPYGCSVCEWRFPDKSGLAAHERIHMRDKPYCCEACNKLLKNKHSMITHMKSHTGESPHCCDVCGDLFVYKSSLYDHSKLHQTTKQHSTP